MWMRSGTSSATWSAPSGEVLGELGWRIENRSVGSSDVFWSVISQSLFCTFSHDMHEQFMIISTRFLTVFGPSKFLPSACSVTWSTEYNLKVEQNQDSLSLLSFLAQSLLLWYAWCDNCYIMDCISHTSLKINDLCIYPSSCLFWRAKYKISLLLICLPLRRYSFCFDL